jgi:tetratricopeptide (TPR) repeat protein
VLSLTDFDCALNELQLGNYSDGMVLLQKLLEEEPEDLDILYNLGICYSERGLLKKSIGTLEKCVQLAPGFDNALVALGFSYYQSGSEKYIHGNTRFTLQSIRGLSDENSVSWYQELPDTQSRQY